MYMLVDAYTLRIYFGISFYTREYEEKYRTRAGKYRTIIYPGYCGGGDDACAR